MNNAENDRSGFDDFKNGSVATDDEVPEGRAEAIVFGDHGATRRKSLEGRYLLFKVQDETRCGFWAVLENGLPDFLKVIFRRGRDLNLKFSWHA